MSKRIELIDSIRSTSTSDIDVQSILAYESIADTYTDIEIAPYGFIKGFGNNNDVILIAKGTLIPYTVMPVIDFPSISLRPIVSFTIPKMDISTGLPITNEFTTLGTSGMYVNYNQSDSVTLASIDIFGNDDGSGNFNEDTYVRII